MIGEYPFTAVAGQENAKRALLLACLNPVVGGVLLTGEKGSAKSLLCYSVRALFPKRKFTVIPLNVTEERLLSHFDMENLIKKGEISQKKGLLDTEPGEILFADDINLLRDSAVNLILGCFGENQTEVGERALLIGTMNPEEGKLRPQLLERFGLCVQMATVEDVETRCAVMERRMAYETNAEEFLAQYVKQEKHLREKLDRAKEAIKKVNISKKMFRLAADIAQEAGCQGNRAEILLLETAKAAAALDGLTEVTTKTLKEAACYVLPHRMGRETMNVDDVLKEPSNDQDSPEEKSEIVPKNSENPKESLIQEEPPFSPPKENQAEAEKGQSEREQKKNEESLQTIHVQLEKDMGNRKNYAGYGKRNRTTWNVKAGHMIRSQQKPDGELALCDTLRQAALHLHEREAAKNVALPVKKEDFRRQIKEGRTGATILFVVDASGSMGAKKRMRAVKGAVISLLQNAYEKRDKVGIVIFSGAGAKVLLSPTRSVDLARKRLMRLPVGGKTPLAEGLELGYRILAEEKEKEKQVLQYLILLTDGKANVSVNGEDAASAARRMAGKIGEEDIHSMVLDTENSYVSLGLAKELANIMGSSYESLQNLSSRQIQNKTKQLIRRNK